MAATLQVRVHRTLRTTGSSIEGGSDASDGEMALRCHCLSDTLLGDARRIDTHARIMHLTRTRHHNADGAIGYIPFYG